MWEEKFGEETVDTSSVLESIPILHSTPVEEVGERRDELGMKSFGSGRQCVFTKPWHV